MNIPSICSLSLQVYMLYHQSQMILQVICQFDRNQSKTIRGSEKNSYHNI